MRNLVFVCLAVAVAVFAVSGSWGLIVSTLVASAVSYGIVRGRKEHKP